MDKDKISMISLQFSQIIIRNEGDGKKLEDHASGQFLIIKNFDCIITFTKPLLSLSLYAKKFEGDLMVKVMIVDDHRLVREGIKALLETFDDIEILCEASNGKEALDMLADEWPDVILMDIKMPEMNGIAATENIMEKYPGIKVIALTSFIEKDLIENSLKAGAVGYLMKNTTGKELISAIRDAAKCHSSLSSEASDMLISGYKTPDYRLTYREKDILTLMVEGQSNNEIAETIIISPSTVKFHVSNILMKLGVSSRNKAVSLAVDKNLVKNGKNII